MNMLSENMTDKDFLNIDQQISMNEKYLDFYYSNYQRTQGKISILTIFYSLISFYLIQTIQFPLENLRELILLPLIFYFILLIFFLYNISISVYNAYLMLKPVDVAFMNAPKVFYTDIKEQYKTILLDNEQILLNDYIKATYLHELEKAVKTNSDLFEEKSKYYYRAFTKGLIALFFYILCSSFVVFYEKEQVHKIEVTNIKLTDTINFKPNNMSNENNNNSNNNDNKSNQNESSQKQQVDSNKIISTEPKMIKESFNKADKIDNQKDHKNN